MKRKEPIRITNEKRFKIMEAFFSTKNNETTNIAKIAGVNEWSANDVISKYFTEGGIIIKSKLS